MSAQVHILAPAPPVLPSLGWYEDLCREVARAQTIDAAKDLADKSQAVRVYARQARNRQLEIDAAEIRLRAERRLGELMAAMQAAGELRGPRERTRSGVSETPQPPTLDQLGVDKNLAKRARALNGLDDFDDRMAWWRETQSAASGKVETRAFTGRPKAERAEHDFYPSPVSIILQVCRRWRPRAKRILEPCDGDGRFSGALREAGHEVTATDLVTGHDFFELEDAGEAALATNPPFNVIRAFIDHAFAIGVVEMALIVPERLFACDLGRQQFERHRPARFAQMDWREDYLNRGGQADRALAVAIWDGPCATRCDYEIWSRET